MSKPEVDWAYSNNMAARRRAFDMAGLFDTSLGTGGDEYEWENRLKKADGRIAYCHDAFIWHRRTPTDVSVRRLLKARWHRGANDAFAQRVMGIKRPHPYKSVFRWALHGVVRRCWNGALVAVYSAGVERGRLRYAGESRRKKRATGPED